LPVSEWLIYRHLWSLPLSGLIPLLRKRISNGILLSYSGEFYFYVWVRRRTRLTVAAFGVIKDVSVLSAQVGNLVTLAMLGLAWPVLGTLQLGQYGGPCSRACWSSRCRFPPCCSGCGCSLSRLPSCGEFPRCIW
jgi:hypothetical protein